MIIYRRKSSLPGKPGSPSETRQSFSLKEKRMLEDITNLTKKVGPLKEVRRPICLHSPKAVEQGSIPTANELNLELFASEPDSMPVGNKSSQRPLANRCPDKGLNGLMDEFSIFEDLEPPVMALEKLKGAPVVRLRKNSLPFKRPTRTHSQLLVNFKDIKGIWHRANRHSLPKSFETDHFHQF